MEERIQINGEWYVRESSKETEKPEKTIALPDPSHYEGLVWENDHYCFDVTRSSDEWKTLLVEFTDKRGGRPNWITEIWDNPEFMVGILDGDADCLKFARETMDADGIRFVAAMTQHLINLNWISR